MKKLIFMSLIFVKSIYSAVIEPEFNIENALNDEYRAAQNTYFALQNTSGDRIQLFIKLKNGDLIRKIVNNDDFTIFAIPESKIPTPKQNYISIDDIENIYYYSYGYTKQWLSKTHYINLSDLLNNAFKRIDRSRVDFGENNKKYEPSNEEYSKIIGDVFQGRAKFILSKSAYDQISTVNIITNSYYQYNEEYKTLSIDQLLPEKLINDLKIYVPKEKNPYTSEDITPYEAELKMAPRNDPKAASEEYGKELMSYLDNNIRIKNIFIKEEPKSTIAAARYILDVPEGNISILSLKYLSTLASIKWNFIKDFANTQYIVTKNDILANFYVIRELSNLAMKTLYYSILASIGENGKNKPQSEIEKITIPLLS